MSTDWAISAAQLGSPTSEGDHAHRAADIDRVVERLNARFPSVPPRDLHDLVSEEFRAFDGARIPTFVPVLAAKAATERLALDHATARRDLTGVFPTGAAPTQQQDASGYTPIAPVPASTDEQDNIGGSAGCSGNGSSAALLKRRMWPTR